MMKEEIIKKAGGYLNVGKYLNENPAVFQEFISNSWSTIELEEFAKTYLADYNHLYSAVMQKISFLKEKEKMMRYYEV